MSYDKLFEGLSDALRMLQDAQSVVVVGNGPMSGSLGPQSRKRMRLSVTENNLRRGMILFVRTRLCKFVYGARRHCLLVTFQSLRNVCSANDRYGCHRLLFHIGQAVS